MKAVVCVTLCLLVYGYASSSDPTWEHITSRPAATPNPECLHLQPYQHLLNIKGLDACEPHHHIWQYLDKLTTINWVCRQNIIGVLADRFGYGTNITTYCACKRHTWTDNRVNPSSKRAITVMDGVPSECFNQKGCLELKSLYDTDICGMHQIAWDKLKACPSDIYVEGKPVSCQAPIVRKMHEKFNTSKDYDNDKCFCYKSFGLDSVPYDCSQYSGFNSIQLLAMIPQNCYTHFSIWKNLAMQPTRCQDWIITFMLDKTTNEFTCDCQDTTASSMFGRSVRKRDSSVLPACQRDSLGYTVLQTTFLTETCHSHWYVWRHLADTSGHCRQYIINKMFSQFATLTPTCQCTARVTPLQQTTMALPPTITILPPTATTLPPTTTTLPVPTTIPPHTCFTCNGPSCATTGNRVICDDAKEFCMTSIIDQTVSGTLERSIERKCVSKQECDNQDQSNNSYCLQMDKGSFGFPMTCHFCCVGADCNTTPGIIPPISTLYSTNKG